MSKVGKPTGCAVSCAVLSTHMQERANMLVLHKDTQLKAEHLTAVPAFTGLSLAAALFYQKTYAEIPLTFVS